MLLRFIKLFVRGLKMLIEPTVLASRKLLKNYAQPTNPVVVAQVVGQYALSDLGSNPTGYWAFFLHHSSFHFHSKKIGTALQRVDRAQILSSC